MGKATDLKFSVRIELKDRKPKNANVWLETSNSVIGLTVRLANQKCKSRSNVCPVGHVNYVSFRTSFDLWNDIYYVHRITDM